MGSSEPLRQAKNSVPALGVRPHFKPGTQPCYHRAMASALLSRPFGWDDVPGLHELNRRASAFAHLGANTHIGDFYWALRAMPDGDPLRDMRVWLGAGSALAAVAWLDPPDSGDAIVAPDADEATLGDALDWLEGERRASGGARLSVVAGDGDAARIELLRRRGYSRSEAGNVRFRRALDAALPAVPLPRGFSLRHVSGDDDIERRVFVETASFEGSPTTADLWRLFAQRLPDYRPALDLLAVAPDGTGASACTCWYDEESRRGEVEAVGTVAGYRQMGLSRAVITEGLSRLRQLGAAEAVLYTNIGNVASNALYRSCGFEAVAEDRAWVKEV